MATTILSLLTPLLPSDPAVSSLLTAHRPLAYPSHLAHGDTHKFLNKLSSFVSVPVAVSSSRSTPASQEFVLTRSESDEWDKRNDACALVIKIIKMDKEGYVLGAGWGKTWLLNLLAALSNQNVPTSYLPNIITLVVLLHTHSHLSPNYQRATSLPNLLKTSQAVLSILKKHSSGDDSHCNLGIVLICLDALDQLIAQSPTPHRVLLPTLLPLLHSLLLSAPSALAPSPAQIAALQKSVASLLARLHTLSGKVAATQTFKGDMTLLINESSACLDAIFLQVWPQLLHNASSRGVSQTQVQALRQQTSVKIQETISARQPVHLTDQVSPSITLSDTSVSSRDRLAGWQRCLSSWTMAITRLLQFPTSRPVALPLGTLISLALRCLSCPSTANLTETMSETLEPEAKLMALSLVSRIWSCGLKILASLVVALGDQVLPHIGAILERTVLILENIPRQDHAARVSLLKFHTLVLSHLHFDPSTAAFHTRLLKHSLTHVSSVLDTKTPQLKKEDNAASQANNHAGGKRGKKRTWGAGEEAVVAGIEGRADQRLSRGQGEVVTCALKLCKVLHRHPSLPPQLLALSIRTHLYLQTLLSTRPATSFSTDDLTLSDRFSSLVSSTLEDALTIDPYGFQQGYTSLIALEPCLVQSTLLPAIVHPMAPPLSRPLPPISSMAFYSVDDEQEQALRKEVGLRTRAEAARAHEVLQEEAALESTLNDVDMNAPDSARANKRVAFRDSAVSTGRVLPDSLATSSSVFGSSAPAASTAAPLESPAPTGGNIDQPAPTATLTLPTPDTQVSESLTTHLATTIEPISSPSSSHQPTQVGATDVPAVAAAAATEPFTSVVTSQTAPITSAPPPQMESSKMTKSTVDEEEEDEPIPEIVLGSDSEDEDEDEEMDE